MEPGGAADGHEAAVDPALAARLLGRARRPGVSDPAHGRALATRLLRPTPPTLADDVARRYVSATLDGTRPPVVYALPNPPSAEGASPPASPAATGNAAAGGAAAVQRKADPSLVVRAAERTQGPALPPVHPLGGGPSIPRAPVMPAAIPVVQARRAGGDGRGGMDGGASGDASPMSPSPVVNPAPTRLRRQLAAEHAAAASDPAPTIPVVRAVPAGSGSGRTADGGGAASSAPASTTVGMAPSGIIQRVAAPPSMQQAADADGEMRVVSAERGEAAGRTIDDAHPAGHPISATGSGPAQGSADVVQRMAAPVVEPRQAAHADGEMRIVPAMPGSETGAGAVDDAHPAVHPINSAQGSVDVVQRVAAPVVEPLREVDAGDERRDVHAVVVARAPSAGDAGAEGGRTLPVVAASAAPGGVVQRAAMAAGGGDLRLVHAAPSPAAGGTVQRAAATSTPPPGAPPAELPTVTARDAPGGVDTGRLAEQVYDILVRRLENERKQRGW